MAKKKKASKTISVDFTDVKGSSKIPEGDYSVKVKEIESKQSSSGNPMLAWVFEVSEGKHAGKTLYHNTSLQPQALFNLRNTLEALQYPVASSAMKINLDELIGLEAAVSVELENYQGKDKPRIVDIFSLEELEEDGEEEDEDEDEDSESEDDSDDDEDEDEDTEDSDEDDDSEDEDEDEDSDDEDEDDSDDEEDEDEEELEEYTEEDLKEMDDEELVDAAGEFEVEPVFKGKGKKKKLDREATIEAILEAQDEEE